MVVRYCASLSLYRERLNNTHKREDKYETNSSNRYPGFRCVAIDRGVLRQPSAGPDCHPCSAYGHPNAEPNRTGRDGRARYLHSVFCAYRPV